MADKQVTLASGAIIVVGPWRVRDVTKLAKSSRQEARGVQGLLARCTRSVESFGPYKAGPDNLLNWGDVGLGDQMVTKLALFSATYPDTVYEPEVPCPKCNFRQHVPIDIDAYLEDYVIPYPEETIQALEDGRNEFPVKVGDHDVVARILTGELQVWAEQYVRQGRDGEDRYARQLGTRVVSIDGVTTRGRITNTINDMTGGEMSQLIAALDEIDGGVDTTILIEDGCVECGAEFEFDLPFGGRDFWTPGNRRMQRDRGRRTRKAIRQRQRQRD